LKRSVAAKQPTGIRGLINQVFESRSLVGDDIYFMDNITAERYSLVEKVSPTISNFSNSHGPF